MKETELLHQTPEQLLQTLEAQRFALRSRHAAAGRHRASILAIGILLIVAIAGIALTVLSSMLADHPRHRDGAAGVSLIEQR